MADERRKGPPERRRARSPKTGEGVEPGVTASPGIADEGEQGPSSPNDTSRHADALDESIRARQQEGYGEVL
jgi:hypothetical protein